MKSLSAAALVVFVAAAPVGTTVLHWPAWVERIGWTLVHSIWQLAVVALVAGLVEIGLRRSAANVRYIASAVALGLMLALPVVTWLCVDVSRAAVSETRTLRVEEPAQFQRQVVSRGGEADRIGERPESVAGDSAPMTDVPDSASAPAILAPEQLQTAPGPIVSEPVVNPQAARALGTVAWLRVLVEPRLPWLVGLWLAGVGLCSLRSICGLLGEWRLRRRGLSPVPESVTQLLAQVAGRMRVSRPVRIAQSVLVRVPLVIGYLRPVILLPVGVVVGLTPAQLEALLAHEVAHIRRHDWLVNALQVLVETMFFYHPAVWWISRRVRNTRELCCDDLALMQVSDRAVFARALLVLEELRQQADTPRAVTSLASTGGQLSARIRRLLPAGSAPEPVSRGWLTGTILLLTLGFLGGVSTLAMPPGESDRPNVAAAGIDDEKAPGAAAKDLDDDGDSGNTATYNDPERGKLPGQLRVVTVVDEQGKPVAGARVRFQFNVEEERLIIGLGPVKTNPQGVAQSEIPQKADHVGIYVTADGFGEGSARELATGATTIKLDRGRVVRVRPLDSEGHVLKDAVPLLAGTNTWGREFEPKKDGVFESPGVHFNRKRLRVACAQAKGPMLFSDPVDVATEKPGKDGVYEVALRPGVRFEGRLDDSVPRPITEGYAELTIVERGPAHQSDDEPWTWKDFAPVRPDGTFVFESIPGGGDAQVHVLVDGYISRNPELEEILTYVRKYKFVDEKGIPTVKERLEHRIMWPQFFRLDQPRVAATIACVPAAACDFRLVDPSGKPVEGATVTFFPNGVFLYEGLFVPGQEESQALLVDGVRTGNLEWILDRGGDKSPHGQEAKRRDEWADRWFVKAQSDADGRVRVRNLPVGGRETFHVQAEGLLLPVSPLLDDEDLAKRNIKDDRDRYGIVDLVSGETVEKTIFLEREQPTADRELIVVDREGKSLAGVSLAVAEIRVGPKEWQTWSTQHFGPLPKGVTDGQGRLKLRLPSAMGKVPVERVRLGVNYHPNRSGRPVAVAKRNRAEEFFISRKMVEIPLSADGGVIVLQPDPDSPNTEDATYPGIVRYGQLDNLLAGKSQAEWLAAMVKAPNVAVLRKLLAGSKLKYPEPAALLKRERRGPGMPGEKRIDGAGTVSTGDGEFTIVEARAWPVNGLLDAENDLSELPKCAYIFNSQGTLLAAVGGELGRTKSNSPDDVDLVNLGPKEDWFITVSRFEENASFDFVTTFYRVASPVAHSVRVFHGVRSGSWSAGPEKVKRYGEVEYEFENTPAGAHDIAVGTNPDGAKVLTSLVWDGDRNRFVGPAAPRLRGKPIFAVDTAWSKEFEPLVPKRNQLVIEGGPYDYGNIWDMAVPDGFQVVVTLSMPQRNGAPQVVVHKLAPGRRNLQFYLNPADKGATTSLEIHMYESARLGGDEKKVKYDLPYQLGARPSAAAPIIQTLDPEGSVNLVKRALNGTTESLTLGVKLVAP